LGWVDRGAALLNGGLITAELVMTAVPGIGEVALATTGAYLALDWANDVGHAAVKAADEVGHLASSEWHSVTSAFSLGGWPTGIRIDESGISIGATDSAQAASRRPTVNRQSRGLFTCPWPGVQGLRLVTDRAEPRQMKNSPNYFTLTNRWGGKAGMTHCNIGVLPSPFMRAELDVPPCLRDRIRPIRRLLTRRGGAACPFSPGQQDWAASSLALPRVCPSAGAPCGRTPVRHALPCAFP
jgi:hypothetical protein